MKIWIKRGIACVAGVAAVVMLGACSTTAAPDYVLVRYEKGANGGLAFESCLQPSQRGDAAINDQTFALPVSLRTWNILTSGGDSADPVQTGTLPLPATKDRAARPGPEVKVYTKTEFFLNTACKEQRPDGSLVKSEDSSSAPLPRFWEATGRRYAVSVNGENGFSDEGWKKMLQNTLVPAMFKSVRSTSRLYDPDVLDANTGNVWALMEKQMGPTFGAELSASVGGADYFCGPGYKRQIGKDGKPTGAAEVVKWTEPQPDPAHPGQFIDVEKQGTCPPVRISITDVVFADGEIAKARAEAYAQDQRNAAALSKAEADKLIAELAKDPNVMRLKEMENERAIAEACSKAGSDCTLIQGVGSNVNVNAK